MNPDTLRAFHKNCIGSALLRAADRMDRMAELLRQCRAHINDAWMLELIDAELVDIPEKRAQLGGRVYEGELAP